VRAFTGIKVQFREIIHRRRTAERHLCPLLASLHPVFQFSSLTFGPAEGANRGIWDEGQKLWECVKWLQTLRVVFLWNCNLGLELCGPKVPLQGKLGQMGIPWQTQKLKGPSGYERLAPLWYLSGYLSGLLPTKVEKKR
jgi:hypothetical protein